MFSPPDAQVTLTKAGEPPIKLTSGRSPNLLAGTYMLMTRSTDHVTRTGVVEVVAGKSKSINLPLAPDGMSRTTHQVGRRRRTHTSIRAGSLCCTALQRRPEPFLFPPCWGSAATKEVKIAHKTHKKTFQTIQVRPIPNEIVHQVKDGDNWFVLDQWRSAGPNLASYRFGFYVPAKDQIAIMNFNYYVDLDIR